MTCGDAATTLPVRTTLSTTSPPADPSSAAGFALSGDLGSWSEIPATEAATPMPTRPRAPCTTPGCGTTTPDGGRCAQCRARRRNDTDRIRGSATDRGYGERWRTRRRGYLTRHPRCVLCGRAATIPDHHPRSRRELLAAGVPDPDADEHLRPLCDPCHRTETARNQPGGWHRERAADPPPF